MTIIEKSANARRDFVRGIVAVAAQKGFSKSELKKIASPATQQATEGLNITPKN